MTSCKVSHSTFGWLVGETSLLVRTMGCCMVAESDRFLFVFFCCFCLLLTWPNTKYTEQKKKKKKEKEYNVCKYVDVHTKDEVNALNS